MAVTVADILESVAMRRGESGTPDNTTENKRRIRFINQAYMNILTKNVYWFTEKTLLNDKTIANQEAYDLPADFRQMIEVRIDDIARYPMPSRTAFDFYQYPPIDQVYSGYYAFKYYFIFDNDIHFIPIPSETSATNNIQYRYYAWPTKLTASTDTVMIPEAYAECLAAFCEARLASLRGMKGTKGDAFEEYNEIVREMNKENMRRAIQGTENGGIYAIK